MRELLDIAIPYPHPPYSSKNGETEYLIISLSAGQILPHSSKIHSLLATTRSSHEHRKGGDGAEQLGPVRDAAAPELEVLEVRQALERVPEPGEGLEAEGAVREVEHDLISQIRYRSLLRFLRQSTFLKFRM